ncbi:MAG: hypothetical protein E7313_08355 [Clostridiales bacterium]|nr:hypothetical protein [Clostridiales bacterium]
MVQRDYSNTIMSSIGIYHKMNKKFKPLLEDFIIFRDIEYCASLKNVKLSNKEIMDLRDVIIDFYNEDSVVNFPLNHSARFIANNYIDNNISIEELMKCSYPDIYDAIKYNDISILQSEERESTNKYNSIYRKGIKNNNYER